MMDFYEFMADCQADGLDPEEAIAAWYKALDEQAQERIDAYENDPMTHEGWAQEDLIDMYRRER